MIGMLPMIGLYIHTTSRHVLPSYYELRYHQVPMYLVTVLSSQL